MLEVDLDHINWKNIFIILLFMSIFYYDSSGQSGTHSAPFNIMDTIKSIYDKHLLPKTNNAGEEIVSFWSDYIDQPEYTLRITKKDNQHYLEGRFLTKRISKLILWKTIHAGCPDSIDVYVIAIPVSDTFTQNMRSAFVRTIDCKKLEKVFNGPWALDGNNYNFRMNIGINKIEEISLYDPEENNPCYNLVVLCKQMANDLKTNSFNESRFIDKFK